MEHVFDFNPPQVLPVIIKSTRETTADGFPDMLTRFLPPVAGALHGDFTIQSPLFPHVLAMRCLLLPIFKRKAERSKCRSANSSVSSG
jgi:hypothetical protein